METGRHRGPLTGSVPLHIGIDARHLRDFGIGTYIRNLVRSLTRLDQENRYSLIVRPGDAQEMGELPNNFELAEYPRMDSEIVNNATFPIFLARFRADLYHIPLNSVAYWMPRPYVVTVHDMSSLLYPPRPSVRTSLHQVRFRRGLARASKVLAVSAATRRDVERLLRIPEERIRLIYNAPDLVYASAERIDWGQTQSILERYQINYPFLLYAGTIRPHKNIPRLIEAFAVLRGELESHPLYRELRLVIIGDEVSKYPRVRQMVVQTRVQQAVRFLGFVPAETLRVFYQSAAVFAFPSLYEGFGLPPLEAMACGTPVVASNIAPLTEAVGDAAILVNPENVFDIARGIREALLDEELRRRMVERGRTQFARFSWERTAREVLEVYREVAAPR